MAWLSALLEFFRLAYDVLLYLQKNTSLQNQRQLREQIAALKGAKDEQTRVRAARNIASTIRKL